MQGEFNDWWIDASNVNKQIDLIHLCLIYLSEDFKIEDNQNDLIKYLQSVFIKQVDNSKYNPYFEYSNRIKEEVDDVMNFVESFEKRGEIKGKIRGKIELLLEYGKTDTEVVQCLMTMKNNPLTEKEATEALQRYYTENNN